MAGINYEEVLSFERAHLGSGSSLSGLLPDGSMEIIWTDVAAHKTADLQAWILDSTNSRITITNPKVDKEAQSGTWRLIDVTTPKTAKKEASIVCRYAKRYDTTIDLAQGRILQGEDWNTNDRFLSVEFRNLDQDKLPSLISSVRGVTYTDPTIGGSDAFAGDWKVLSAQPSWADDGSGILVIHIGDPNFVLTSFQNYILPSHQDVTYLFNVPKDSAQAMIDGYKDEGTSVSVSYSGASDIPGTVDLVVRENSTQPVVDFDVAVASLCDLTTTTYHRWGFPDKASAFVYANSFPSGSAGERKTISVSFNETSGKYNVIVSIAQRTLEDATLSFDVGRDEDTTDTYDYRWHLDGDSAAVFVASYSEPEEGLEKSVRVTRTEECTFHVVGIISSEVNSEKSVSILMGISELADRSEEYRWNLSLESMLAFQLQYESKDPRVMKTFALTRKDNKLYDAKGTETRIDSSSAADAFSTSHEEESFDYSFNVTEAEKDAILGALGDTDETGNKAFSLTRNSNDTYTVVSRLRRSKPFHQNFSWTIGEVQHGVDWYFGQSRDQMVTLIDALNNDGIRYSVQISRGGDGTYQVVSRHSEDLGASVSAVFGNAGELETDTFHWGLSLPELTAVLGSVGNDTSIQRKSIRISRDNEGEFSAVVSNSEAKESAFNAAVDVGGNYIGSSFFSFGLTDSTIPVINAKQGTKKTLNIQRDRDGTITTREDQIAVEAWTSPVFDSSINKNSHVTGYLFHNYENIPTLTTPLGSISATYDQATQTYSGAIREVIFSVDGGSVDHWDNYESPDWIRTSKILTHTKANTKRAIRAPIFYKVKQTKSRARADTFINDGPSTEADPGGAHPASKDWAGAGSKIDILAGGTRYRATYVHPYYDGYGDGAYSSVDSQNNHGLKSPWEDWDEVGPG